MLGRKTFVLVALALTLYASSAMASRESGLKSSQTSVITSFCTGMTPALNGCDLLGRGVESRLMNVRPAPPGGNHPIWRGSSAAIAPKPNVVSKKTTVTFKGNSTVFNMHPMLQPQTNPVYTGSAVMYSSDTGLKRDIAARASRSSNVPLIGSLIDAVAGTATLEANQASNFEGSEQFLYAFRKQEDFSLSLKPFDSTMAAVASIDAILFARLNAAMATHGPYNTATAVGKFEWQKILFNHGDSIVNSITYGSTCAGMQAVQNCSAADSAQITGAMSTWLSSASTSGGTGSSGVASLVSTMTTLTTASCPAKVACVSCSTETWSAVVANHALDGMAVISYTTTPLYEYIANTTWKNSLKNATLDYWALPLYTYESFAQSATLPPLSFYPQSNITGTCDMSKMTCADPECASNAYCKPVFTSTGTPNDAKLMPAFKECQNYLIATANAAVASGAGAVGAQPSMIPNATTSSSSKHSVDLQRVGAILTLALLAWF